MFKPHVQNFSDCLKPKSETRNYKDITSKSRKESDPNTRIYALEKEAKLPTWANFVAGIAEPNVLDAMKVQSASALVLFKVETVDGPRIFAASYGAAFSLIDTSLIESNFGLKTTINAISPNKIKNIDFKNLSSRSVGKRENARKAASIAKFSFEHESEVLKSISGTSIDHDLGISISGGSSLKISIKDLQPEQLGTVAQKAYDKYMLQTYKEHFDFIDHFEQVKDVMLTTELDNELVLALGQAAPPERMFLVYPDQISANECSYFKLTVSNTNENFDDIEVRSLHKFLQGNASNLDIDTIKSDSHITGLDDNEEAMTPRKSIYSLLYFEVTYADELYVLSDSKWYKISKDFVNDLNKWVSKNVKQSELKLKDWFSTQTEWDYSELYQEDKDYVVLSRQSFRVKRHGDLFVADLYHKPSGSLVFLKKLSTATPLNGQLEQAVTVTDLLREENAEAWKFLLERLKQKWPEIDEATVSKNLSVVFVVNSDQEIPDALPVFDKVAFKKSTKALKKLQIKTSLQKISVGLKN
jgi:uncharacterized protein (TIGR04141 family)